MGKLKVSELTIKQIKRLRERGQSLSEIALRLKISKTTVFRYINGIEILPKFRMEWAIKRGGSRKRMHLMEDLALNEINKIVFDLSNKEKLLYLSALYWAEGSKNDLRLSNTDPNLVSLFVKGLREIFNVPDDRIQVSLRLYEDLNFDQCRIFWSEITGISKEEITSIDILKGKKIGKLRYGMCSVRVKKGNKVLKKIKAVNKVVYELMSP